MDKLSGRLVAVGEITEKIKRGWAGRKMLIREGRRIANIGNWSEKTLVRQWPEGGELENPGGSMRKH